MAVLRGVRDRRFKFTQVLNSMLDDENLSLKAKGLITYCLSKPDGWKFHMSYLVSKLKEGERAIYSTMEEMEREGYAIRYQPRKENGDFDSWETLVSDSKEEIALLKEEMKNDSNFQNIFTLRCFADAQLADAQNVPISNTNCASIQKQPQKQAAPPPAAAPLEKTIKMYECLVHLNIPDSDKMQIQRAYPEDIVENAVKYATHPETKIKTTLVQTIKWACKDKPEVPVSYENAKKEAEEIVSKCKKVSHVSFWFNHNELEINFPTAQKESILLKYSEKGFKEQLLNILRKLDLYVPGSYSRGAC